MMDETPLIRKAVDMGLIDEMYQKKMERELEEMKNKCEEDNPEDDGDSYIDNFNKVQGDARGNK